MGNMGKGVLLVLWLRTWLSVWDIMGIAWILSLDSGDCTAYFTYCITEHMQCACSHCCHIPHYVLHVSAAARRLFYNWHGIAMIREVR